MILRFALRVPILVLAALSLFGQTFSAEHAAGEALIRSGKLALAIPYLERAAKLDPSHYANRWDLALCYFRLKRLPEAARQLQSMSLQFPGKAEVFHLWGDVEAAAGQARTAAELYFRAATLDPSEEHIASLAAHLTAHNATDNAVEWYRKGIELHPASAQLRIGLGVALYAKGEYDPAVESLLDGIDRDPKDLRALEFLGKMLDASPRHADRLQAALQQYVTLYPKNARAQLYYGMSLWRRFEGASGDAASAEQHLRQATALDPKSVEAHHQLGILYDRQQRSEEAILALRTALRLQPQLNEARYRLAQLYQRTGKPALAKAEFEILRARRGN